LLFPKIDPDLWTEACERLPAAWRCHFCRLRPSERAHVLRVYAAVKNDSQLKGEERRKMILLALVHDIGKGVTRHGVVFKVAKVLLPIRNTAHCLAGAQLLKKLGAESWLQRLVLRHHSPADKNSFMARFKRFDDRL
jgi:predicted HD phosphohydrolase